MNPRSAWLVLAAALATPSWAQPAVEDHAAHHPASAAAANDLTDGEIRKVDKAAMKLTIRHGEIRSLDMPPMTMVFQIKDGAMLDAVKAGDKVRFAAVKTATGYAVTELRPAP